MAVIVGCLKNNYTLVLTAKEFDDKYEATSALKSSHRHLRRRQPSRKSDVAEFLPSISPREFENRSTQNSPQMGAAREVCTSGPKMSPSAWDSKLLETGA